MIIADKIMENRKKNGWSQEELAEKVGVSRQSVSKWESAQSVPDMKRILQLSEVFGVSTDYLLRDDIEEESPGDSLPIDSGIDENAREVSMEEASAFLSHNEKAASVISTGVMICILSPIVLFMLAGLSQAGKIPLTENAAGMGGVAVLLAMVSTAVAMFVMTGMRGKPFEYLGKENIETEYGVSSMAKERRQEYAETHSRQMVIGIIMCIAAVIPFLALQMMNGGEPSDLATASGMSVMLAIIAVGVKIIVLTSIRNEGYDKLLEEGDYTRLNKKIQSYDGIYWAIALAIYLAWSFITFRWEFTWIVWPVAGVLFAAYKEILKIIASSKS